MQENVLALLMASVLASFLGSWHCALMCGPISANFRTSRDLFLYQFGRVLSYTLAGGLSGAFGEFLLGRQLNAVRILLGISFGILLIFQALSQMGLNKGRLTSWLQPSQLYLSILRFFKAQGVLKLPFFAGVITVILPCAWLLTWIIGAASTHSAFAGALLLFILAIGGIPALSAISVFMRRGHQLSSKKQKTILAIGLTIAGLYAILSHLAFGLGYVSM